MTFFLDDVFDRRLSRKTTGSGGIAEGRPNLSEPLRETCSCVLKMSSSKTLPPGSSDLIKHYTLRRLARTHPHLSYSFPNSCKNRISPGRTLSTWCKKSFGSAFTLLIAGINSKS